MHPSAEHSSPAIPEMRVAPNTRRLAFVGIALGAVLLAVGSILEPQRGLSSLLVVGVMVATLGVGAGFFVALQHVTGAGWSAPLRRIPEAIAQTIPVGGLLLLPALVAARVVYPWLHPAEAASHELASKSWWLSYPFFLGRSLAYLAIWTFLAHRLWHNSVAQDSDGDLVHTRRNVRLSVGYLLLFGVTFSAASFDWLMSLDPHWATTMFAVYNFAGTFVSSIALIIVVVISLRRAGMLGSEIGVSHLHDLGRLMFGFSSFWAYIWFSQLMLIWYANMPEETAWYLRRLDHGWVVPFAILPVIMWIIPFFSLMTRAAKRSETALLHVAALVLVGRWLDLLVIVAPSQAVRGWPVGFAELGATLLAASGLFLAIVASLRRAPLVAQRDPYLQEGIHHHVGHTI